MSENSPGPMELRFQDMLRKAVELGATDVHFKPGLPPVVRLQGDLKLLSRKASPVESPELEGIARAILPTRARAQFDSGREADMAYSFPGVGRFRLNVFRYRGQVGIVARFIPFDVRSIEELGLPPVLKKIAVLPRGLVLVSGITGSGKSTTLAAMLNEWNMIQGGHIVTIEDPVEYLIRDKRAIITQREVGLDTESFAAGLKNALRQDPDVIMIGELRDRETILTALNAAETGHLVLSTLHTKDALETVNRIIGVFEPESQREVRMQFASALSAIVSQRLLPTTPELSSKGRSLIVASEILINTPRIRDCLMESNKTGLIREALEQGSDSYGTQTFDQDLLRMLTSRWISRETALRNATSPADFELRLRGIQASDRGHTAKPLSGKSLTDVGLEGPSLELDAGPRRKKD
jgi:twitching motility protein PilT